MAAVARPTMSPSILGNDPGRLVNGDFTRSSGLIAAAAIFSTLFVIGMWALFYVYWYMPWHGKQLNDCCGRELDNTCSHDCVLKCKEDTEACPDKCHETCPGCNNPEPLSIRARDPNWNKAHVEGHIAAPILAPLPPIGSIQRYPTMNQPVATNTGPPYNSAFVPPPSGNYGVSPLGANAQVYNPVGGPTIGGPTIGGPTMGVSPLGAGAVPTYNAPVGQPFAPLDSRVTVGAPGGPTMPAY